MIEEHENRLRADQEQLAREVGDSSDQVKLLAINLAIVIAKARRKTHGLEHLDYEFTDLISRVNEASKQIKSIIHAFQNHGRMVDTLPPLEIVPECGSYDQVEANLKHILDLSLQIEKMITKMSGQKQAG